MRSPVSNFVAKEKIQNREQHERQKACAFHFIKIFKFNETILVSSISSTYVKKSTCGLIPIDASIRFRLSTMTDLAWQSDE